MKRLYRVARSFVKDPTELIANSARQNRLLVGKAKWRGNAQSPVCLTIDDLANAWFDANNNGVLDPGEDWGGMLAEPNSAFDLLKKDLLKHFPEVKITFFTVMGSLSSFERSRPFTAAKPIDATIESLEFFRAIHFSSRFEIAYHGYDHGTPGEKNEDFLQEWENVSSVDQSLEKINKGARIYASVFWEKPRGGKTGAYIMNRAIEESIDIYGFTWWCRDLVSRSMRKDTNNILFEPKFFGENRIIDIPTTINGRVWYRRQINNLLRNRQVITIAEHISPFGAGVRYIRPNIFDDIPSLTRLFRYLNGKNVWHATVSEIAEYINAYTFSHIFDATKNTFQMRYAGKLKDPILTIMIDPFCLRNHNQHGYLKITLPDKSILSRQQYYYDKRLGLFLVDTPVQNGIYHVDWARNPVPKLEAKVREDGRIIYNCERLSGLIHIEMRKRPNKFFKYVNNGRETTAKYYNSNTITVFCVNSNESDRILGSSDASINKKDF